MRRFFSHKGLRKNFLVTFYRLSAHPANAAAVKIEKAQRAFESLLQEKSGRKRCILLWRHKIIRILPKESRVSKPLI